MLPGKKYALDDYLRILWRRRWLIAVPLVVVASATAVVSYFLPNRYRAATSILVVPQRVPEDFVQSTVTAELGERLNIISQQILSRTKLEGIIQEVNLYRRERETMIMEDVVERMRKDISLNVSVPRRGRRTEASSFSISFESENPRTAMRVTERLASLFVQENMSDRNNIADQTDQFLQSQLEESRRRLVEHEDKLQKFRQQYNGQLPDQVESNLRLLQASQLQLQNLTENSLRDRDRFQILEKNLAEVMQTATSTPAPANPGRPEQPFVGTAARQVEAARAQLQALQLRLKPEHPDVRRLKSTIAELEAKAEAEALQQPLSQTTAAAPVIVDRQAQARVEAIRAEMQQIQQRLESSRRESTRLQGTIDSFTARVQSAPALESELTKMMRDYNTLRASYESLVKKSEESRLAVDLERRQIGEQFRVIDGARLPERPISPDRVRINMFGILGGLGLGLALIALLEYRDTSFKTDDDIVTTLALPVVAVIPLMTSAGERRTLRRRNLWLAAGASAVCMAAAAAVVVVLKYDLLDRFR